MRFLIRALIVAALIGAPTATFHTAAPGDVEVAPAVQTTVEDPVVSCESAPAPDTGDVKIGTALTLYRGPDAADFIDDCDGTVTVQP